MPDADWLDAGVPSDESGAIAEVIPHHAKDVDAAGIATQMLQLQWYDAKDDGSLTSFAEQTNRAFRDVVLYGHAYLPMPGAKELTDA